MINGGPVAIPTKATYPPTRQLKSHTTAAHPANSKGTLSLLLTKDAVYAAFQPHFPALQNNEIFSWLSRPTFQNSPQLCSWTTALTKECVRCSLSDEWIDSSPPLPWSVRPTQGTGVNKNNPATLSALQLRQFWSIWCCNHDIWWLSENKFLFLWWRHNDSKECCGQKTRLGCGGQHENVEAIDRQLFSGPLESYKAH